MANAEVLLAVLKRGASHGYEVKRAHDEWFPDARPLAYGQVYSTLARLERDGLIEVVERSHEGAAERTVYALTDAGRQHLMIWLAQPEAQVEHGADEIVRKTVAALRIGEGAAGFVSVQRSAHLRRLHELVGAPVPTDPLARLARDHTIAALDAELRWLETAVDRAHQVDRRGWIHPTSPQHEGHAR